MKNRTTSQILFVFGCYSFRRVLYILSKIPTGGLKGVAMKVTTKEEREALHLKAGKSLLWNELTRIIPKLGIFSIILQSTQKGGKRPLPFNKTALHAGGQRFESPQLHQ